MIRDTLRPGIRRILNARIAHFSLDSASQYLRAGCMGQGEEGGLTQEQARLLWRSDPEEAFRRFRNHAITLIEICAAVHFEAKIASDPTDLSIIFEPFRELLTSTRESAKNLWWCTPLSDFLTRPQPVIVVCHGDLRSRLDGSCYHEVAINCADALLGGVDAGNTARQHAAHLRFHTGRGDLVTDYLKSLVADIRCEFRDGLDSFRLSRASEGPGTNAPCGQAVASQGQSQLPLAVEVTHQPRPFAGGMLEFLADSVRLCGVEICMGGRPKRMREVLELLRQKNPDGSFRAISGAELAELLGIQEARVASLFRDLRKFMSASLSGKGIHCGRLDVILSGGSGYRLSDKLSVQQDYDAIEPVSENSAAPSEAACEPAHEPSEPDTSAIELGCCAHEPGSSPIHGPVEPSREANLGKMTDADRRTWIINEIAEGQAIRASHIVAALKVSKATVKRDLKALQDQGKIQFVGTNRQGHYELRE